MARILTRVVLPILTPAALVAVVALLVGCGRSVYLRLEEGSLTTPAASMQGKGLVYARGAGAIAIVNGNLKVEIAEGTRETAQLEVREEEAGGADNPTPPSEP